MKYLLISALLMILYILWRWLASRKAPFFTPQQEQAFLALVQGYFSDRHLSMRIENGAVHLDDQLKTVLGLGNLLKVCRLSRQASWKKIITNHFDTVYKAFADCSAVDAELADFSKVRDRLVVRMLGRENISDMSILVMREDLPLVQTYLALDLPDSIRSLRPEEVAPWGVSTEELFTIGLQNVRKLSDPTVKVQEFHGLTLVGMEGPSFYTHAHALLLPEHPECLGPYGALVIVPTRHVVICHPIRDKQVANAINFFIRMAHDLAAKGPGTITEKLYWYRNGQFIELPFRLWENEIQFMPPEEFITVLKELAPAEHAVESE